ncbi:MAG: peptidyl-prolyl cis-trans isomerase [Phycisphaerales bacterium]|nr:MAG: peptidyl-prolyl cis-trans isomerase [Phycisphaerales bacterium]
MFSFRPGRLVLTGVALVLLPGGCASEPNPFSGLDESDRTVGGRQVAAHDRPPAAVDGRGVSWADLHPLLAERAGGEILEELALDRRLRELAERRGVSITDADVGRERDRLRENVSAGAGVDAEEAERLVEQLRVARGLGPTRYRMLLERNALLRALVAGEVEVEEETVRRAFEVRHGERVRARLFVSSGESQASEVRRRVRASAAPVAAFAEAAVEFSVDQTGANGGRLGRISPSDTTLPAALRTALRRTEPGSVSPVIALDAGFALVLVEERVPPDPVAFEAVESVLREEVRLSAERAAMDRLASSILGRSGVEPIDAGLEWSWRRGRAERR